MTQLVVGLAGPAGAGKSTIAHRFAQSYLWEQYSFAAPIYGMVRSLFFCKGIPYLHQHPWFNEYKEQPCPYLNGKSVRHALQTLGTEWGRDLIGENFWADFIKDLAETKKSPIIVDDTRFPSEVHAIHSVGGRVYWIDGRAKDVANPKHRSENSIERNKLDGIISNTGTIEDASVALYKLIAQEGIL